MSYLVFARKYRPRDFSQVIGQEGVVDTLEKSLNNGRVHHAYLFSGPRGVGKTSMARILAKSLNCLSSDKPTVKPCGKCDNCLQIAKGTSMDVIEIDGASNRGIDEIRQLRENVRFAPSNSRFKLYIIDEVHQITHDAFNALLKTLEEPPAHVKFIFATTNPSKVPITILSRCQKLKFSLLSEDKIAQKLRYIAQEEGIEVEEALFKYISRASFGSIRDAESIFDQVVPLIVEGTDLKSILGLLGQIPEYRITDFIRSLLDKDTTLALQLINEIVEEGRDLDNFLTTAIECLRNVMLAKLGESLLLKVSAIPPELAKQFSSLADKANMPYMLDLVDAFIKAKRESKFLPSLRIPMELAIIRHTYENKNKQDIKAVSKADDIKPSQNNSSQSNKGSTGFTHKTAALNLESVSKVFDKFKKPKQPRDEIIHKQQGNEEAKAEEGSLDIERVKQAWPDVLDSISKQKMAMATYLKESVLVQTKGFVLYLGFPKNLSFHKEFLDTSQYRQLLEEEVNKALDVKTRVCYVLLEYTKELERKDTRVDIVKQIKDEFDGEIVI